MVVVDADWFTKPAAAGEGEVDMHELAFGLA